MIYKRISNPPSLTVSASFARDVLLTFLTEEELIRLYYTESSFDPKIKLSKFKIIIEILPFVLPYYQKLLNSYSTWEHLMTAVTKESSPEYPCNPSTVKQDLVSRIRAIVTQDNNVTYGRKNMDTDYNQIDNYLESKLMGATGNSEDLIPLTIILAGTLVDEVDMVFKKVEKWMAKSNGQLDVKMVGYSIHVPFLLDIQAKFQNQLDEGMIRLQYMDLLDAFQVEDIQYIQPDIVVCVSALKGSIGTFIGNIVSSIKPGGLFIRNTPPRNSVPRYLGLDPVHDGKISFRGVYRKT